MANASGVRQLIELVQRVRTELGSDAASVFVLGSGLVDSDGNVSGAAASYAGVISANDAENGVWVPSANIPFKGLSAQWSPTGRVAGSLNVGGVAILREFPGKGSMVWSARMITGLTPTTYLTDVRTIDTMQRSITQGLLPYVFAANDAVTWSTVTANVSGYLMGWWKEGALFGPTSSIAYTVECGIGTTMTSQDILNGEMVVSITVRLSASRPPTTWTQSQRMQGV